MSIVILGDSDFVRSEDLRQYVSLLGAMVKYRYFRHGPNDLMAKAYSDVAADLQVILNGRHADKTTPGLIAEAEFDDLVVNAEAFG